nr:hypothetical protein [uncultured Kingella sp.]
MCYGFAICVFRLHLSNQRQPENHFVAHSQNRFTPSPKTFQAAPSL